MPALARSMAAHDGVVLAHVERLPGLADLVVEGGLETIRVPLEFECRFLVEGFLPLMRAVEAVVYPELDALMSCCHSMLGMRNEHREIERLIVTLERASAEIASGRFDAARRPELRHALYRLRSITRVHLEVETRLIRVLEHNIVEDLAEVLAASVDSQVGGRR